MAGPSLEVLRAQRFSGRVARSFLHRGRSFEENFSLIIHPDKPDDLPTRTMGSGWSLLEVRSFTEQPKVLPAVLYDRLVPSVAPPEVFVPWFFAGNRVRDPVGGAPGARWDEGTGLPDEQFWSLIEVLHGSVAAGGLNRLADRLATAPDEVVSGFAVALVEHLVALDDPGNAVRIQAAGHSIVSDDASLYYRCWMVTQGPSVFQAGVEQPGGVVRGRGWARGENLLEVVDGALIDRFGSGWPAGLVTRMATGSNQARWGPVPRPKPPGYMKPSLEARQANLLSGVATARFVRDLDLGDAVRYVPYIPDDPLADAWYNANVVGQWFGTRLLTQVEGGYRELIIHFTDPALEPDPAPILERFLADRGTSWGRIVAHDPIRPTHTTGSSELEVIFAIRRSSTLSTAAYLDRYIHGVL